MGYAYAPAFDFRTGNGLQGGVELRGGDGGDGAVVAQRDEPDFIGAQAGLCYQETDNVATRELLFFTGGEVEGGHSGFDRSSGVWVGYEFAVKRYVFGERVGFGGDYIDCSTGLYAGGASVAVRPCGFVYGQVIVYHVVELFDVESAGGEVGGHEHSHGAVGKKVDCCGALFLVEGSMIECGRDVVGFKPIVYSFGALYVIY